jgi:hypothetical protein
MKKLAILALVVGGVALLECLPAPQAAAYFEEHRGGRVWGGGMFGGGLVNSYLGAGGYQSYGGYGFQNYGNGGYIYRAPPVYRTYPAYGGVIYSNPGYVYPGAPLPGIQVYRYGPYPGYGYAHRGFYE